MNPWLQRFLVSWAAGVAATGALVSTAKRPGKLKPRKKRRRADGSEEPVQMGAVALQDVRAADDRGLTAAEWRANVVASARGARARVAEVFSRTAPAPAPRARDGARAPDEVQSQEGTAPAPAPAATTSVHGSKARDAKVQGSTKGHGSKGHGSKGQGTPAARKRSGAHAKGRTQGRAGHRRRPQASLWDSARESLRQTVRDTVREEVKESPVGAALETLKTVGEKVREGASTAATAAHGALQKVLEAGESATRATTAAPPDGERGQNVTSSTSGTSTAGADDDGRAAEAPPTTDGRGVPGVASGDASAPGATTSVDVQEVARKVRAGADAVGTWLQGPGTPGYPSARVRRSGTAADVVEAKDAPAPSPAPADDAPQPTEPTSDTPGSVER